uniref:Tubby protein homolog n=1 Tax=Petromyzon marinus TaxID=7757 RepID=A0AAJ7SU79_PETMA|nr:tubby protein homolog [Petromyzon marinus]
MPLKTETLRSVWGKETLLENDGAAVNKEKLDTQKQRPKPNEQQPLLVQPSSVGQREGSAEVAGGGSGSSGKGGKQRRARRSEERAPLVETPNGASNGENATDTADDATHSTQHAAHTHNTHTSHTTLTHAVK